MPNYGVFTEICVLQEFKEKKLKSNKMQQIGLKIRAAADLAKAGSVECRNSVARTLRGRSGKKNVVTKFYNVTT